MLTSDQLMKLKELLPDKVFNDSNIIIKHSGNQFYTTNYYPDAVCYPDTIEDILKITQFCIDNRISLIPYGSGTSVEGHLAAINGGVTVNLSKLNKVIEFSPEDNLVIVEPGIAYNQLNNYLEQYGYHFPVEAGWGASIGGMVSTNASGAGAVDSGSMGKNVLGCNVVVYDNNSNAKIIKTGTKSVKSSAGYNLTSLFVGAEGTLGIITQITLKIRKNFDATNTICCQFDDIEKAIRFVIDMKSKVHFRRAELMDRLQTNACIEFSKINYLNKDYFTILIELAGNKLAVNEEADIIMEYLKNKEALNIKHYPDSSSAKELWMVRKNACPAAISYLGPNKKAMATDISVPISHLANCIKECYKKMDTFGIKAPLVAHIGDGNFHFTVLLDPNNLIEMQKAKEFNASLVEESLRHGGTCTGEHGVGCGKIPYVEKEHGDCLFLMENLKKSFDPKNIFNPGKIFNLSKSLNFGEEFKGNQQLGMFSNRRQ